MGAMGLLEGKVGLVTGAAQGLGRATARLAAREGSAVVRADVTIPSDLEELVKRTVGAFGALDWACNNAVGGAGGFGPLHEIDDRTWDRTLAVTLSGVFYAMKYEIAAMLHGAGGSIVNITTAG